MTKEEIINKGVYTNHESENFSEFELNIFIPFFEKKIPIKVFGLSNLDDSSEMDILVERVNEILKFSMENKEWLQQEIWKHYEICIANTSYGMVDYENFKNEIDANKVYFSIFNANDALERAIILQVHFDLTFKDENYFNLEYECPWEDEHGIIITIKDGNFDSIT
ncbi:hypothetical protein [Aquimarina sp. MMG016]|uniref:DUF6985 domain-containing protein n=1 Tax=Aquimarina sp. MMG016 TaxID=2822690 RepID=UPI001B3A7289|nr:hypothetical protein [Aquimarina sp. MMG016]MBQ4821511.1 hypothetical protein [Aquimarina sp. MMG016]